MKISTTIYRTRLFLIVKTHMHIFHKFSSKVSTWVGTPFAFFSAFTVILIWSITGPAFGFSDTWQLVINTSTTIVTFLMVFLIQNTQNRDAKATHLKLDELVRSQKGARNSYLNIEDLGESELDALREEFQTLHDEYTRKLERIESAKKRKRKKK